MLISELKQSIKNLDDGRFLFYGEEDYLKRYYTEEYRRAVVTDESFAVFNHFRFDGATIDFAALSDAVKAPSMMCDKKLIEWSGADFSAMKERDLEALAEFCEECEGYSGNVVIFTVAADRFDPGTKKKPSKLYTKLSKMLSLVDFPLSTDAQLSSWIVRHFAKEGLRPGPGCVDAIIGKAGHNMTVLDKEIEKMCCYALAHGMEDIPAELVEPLVCGTVESDAFSLTEALLSGDYEAAYTYLDDMALKKAEPIAVLGQVAKLYCDLLTVGALTEEGLSQGEISKTLKMHEFRVGLYMKGARRLGLPMLRRTVKQCADMDAGMKNGSANFGGFDVLIAGLAAHERRK